MLPILSGMLGKTGFSSGPLLFYRMIPFQFKCCNLSPVPEQKGKWLERKWLDMAISRA
jgi:hypothetical protein